MTSSPSSSTARLPEHPECPVCFGTYDTTKFIPMASGIPGCSHNGCTSCVQQLAEKTASLNIKRCVQSCVLTQNDLRNLSLESVKPAPNTDLIKAIEIIAEQSAIISALRSNTPMGSKDSSEEFLAMQAFLVGQITELNNQFALAQESIKELKKANSLLNSENSELKERVSAQPPVASPSMPVVVQPQPPYSSKDLRDRITQLIEQPVISCSSSDRSQPCSSTDLLTSEPAASSVIPYTKEQMNTLFPPGTKNHVKMQGMSHAVLHATIQAESFVWSNQFDMLSNTQWENLPLSRMPVAQIKLMFLKSADVHWINIHSARMKMIPRGEVQGAIMQEKINDIHIFSYIPNEHLKGLRLSALTVERVQNLLLANGDTNVSAKLLNISHQEIYAAILGNKMNRSNLLGALPIDCLRDLPLSQMTAAQIQLMFPNSHDIRWKNIYRTRISMIRPEELSAAFQANKLNGYLADYLPPNFSFLKQYS